MAKLIYTLGTSLKCTLNYARVYSWTAVITREKSAHFCRYSCISDDIIDIIL